MEQTWRWFGPDDVVKLADARQAGATGIVTALHQIPYGVVWSTDEIERRKALIEGDSSLGLRWSVVESLPVAEPIKLGEGDLEPLFENYRQSLRNLAACGVTIVCYNFMPVLDWTRTELHAVQPGGGRALRFNAHEFAAFDCFMLERPGAEADHPPEVVARGARLVRRLVRERPAAAARQRHGRPARRLRPLRHPRPAADAGALSRHDPRDAARQPRPLPARGDPDRGGGRDPHVHPPRRSAAPDLRPAADRRATPTTSPSSSAPASRTPTASPSARARSAPVPPTTFRRWPSGSRARSSSPICATWRRSPTARSWKPTISAATSTWWRWSPTLLEEQGRRRDAGDPRWRIPFRPDHGHELLDDIGKAAFPGYSAIGRLKGLAEIRGVMTAVANIRRLPI